MATVSRNKNLIYTIISAPQYSLVYYHDLGFFEDDDVIEDIAVFGTYPFLMSYDIKNIAIYSYDVIYDIDTYANLVMSYQIRTGRVYLRMPYDIINQIQYVYPSPYHIGAQRTVDYTLPAYDINEWQLLHISYDINRVPYNPPVCYGYVFCGRNDSDTTAFNYRSYRYDWRTDDWSEEVYAEPGPLVWKTTGFSVYQEQTYRVGGQNVYGDLTSGIIKYTYTTTTWESYSAMSSGVAEMYHFSCNYFSSFIGGGFTQTSHTDPVLTVSAAHYQLSVPGLGFIVARTDKPADEAGYSAACGTEGATHRASYDRGYVTGGHDDAAAITTHYAYDPVTHVWTAKSSPPSTASYPTGFDLIILGWMGFQADGSIYAYKPRTDTWVTPDLDSPISAVEAAANIGWGRETTGYVIGGGDVASVTAYAYAQFINFVEETASTVTDCPMAGVAMGSFLLCLDEDTPVPFEFDILYDIEPPVQRSFRGIYYDILPYVELPIQSDFRGIYYDILPYIELQCNFRGIYYDIEPPIQSNFRGIYYDIGEFIRSEPFEMSYDIEERAHLLISYDIRALTARYSNCVGVLVGGKTGGNPLNFSYQAQHYSEANDSWSLGGDAEPAPLVWYAAGVNVRDRGYRVGGMDIYGDTVDVLSEYNEIKKVWVSRLVIPRTKSNAATFAIGEDLYTAGGRTQTGHTQPLTITDTHYRYTPSTNSWTSRDEITTARYHAAVFTYDGKGYAAGGNDAGGATDDLERYDPLVNSWATRTSLTSTVDFPTGISAVDFNRGYVQNGTDLQRYGAVADSWTTLANHYAAAFYRAGYQGWSDASFEYGYIVTGGPDTSTTSTDNRQFHYVVETTTLKTAATTGVIGAAGFFMCLGFPMIYDIMRTPVNLRFKYDVGDVSRVQDNLEISYDIILSADLPFYYDIEAISADFEFGYDINGFTDDSLELLYDIGGYINDSLELLYDIDSTTDFPMYYDIIEWPKFQMTYDVGEHGIWTEFEPNYYGSYDFSMYYDIKGAPTSSIINHYDIHRPQWNSLLIHYNVSGYYDYYDYYGYYYTQISIGLPSYDIRNTVEAVGADGQVALGQPLVVRARILHGSPTTHRDSGTVGYTNPLYNLSVVWRLDSRDKDNYQTAYQVQVDKSNNFDTTWMIDSGLVVSTDQIYRAGQAKLFDDITRYWARVRVRDRYNVWSDWEITCYP